MARRSWLIAILTTMLAVACAPAAPPSPTAAPAKQEAKPAAKQEGKAEAKAAASKDLPRTMSIGTNQAGTGAHAIGSGLGKVASTHLSTTLKVVPATGPNVWITQMDQGEIEFGIMNVLDSSLAYKGEADYSKPYKKLRLVSGGTFPFSNGLVVRKDSDIKTIADVKGRRVSSDFGGHVITRILQDAFLASAGLTMNDVQAVPVPSVPAATTALVEGRVDAAYTSVGIGSTEEANAAVGIRFLPAVNTPEGQAAVTKIAPGVRLFEFKAGSATGIVEDTPLISYHLHLVGWADVPDNAVYSLMKVWWENVEELQAIHPQLKRWTHENQVFTEFTIPYHNGTVAFFKEINRWTPEMEQRQAQLLAQ